MYPGGRPGGDPSPLCLYLPCALTTVFPASSYAALSPVRLLNKVLFPVLGFPAELLPYRREMQHGSGHFLKGYKTGRLACQAHISLPWRWSACFRVSDKDPPTANMNPRKHVLPAGPGGAVRATAPGSRLCYNSIKRNKHGRTAVGNSPLHARYEGALRIHADQDAQATGTYALCWP